MTNTPTPISARRARRLFLLFVCTLLTLSVLDLSRAYRSGLERGYEEVEANALLLSQRLAVEKGRVGGRLCEGGYEL